MNILCMTENHTMGKAQVWNSKSIETAPTIFSEKGLSKMRSWIQMTCEGTLESISI